MIGGRKIVDPSNIPLRQYLNHPRNWRENLYVYPVLSRRSGGLSIGVNLNPDGACNFDCIYCQVDRTVTPRIRDVDPKRLEEELAEMIRLAGSGELFEDPAFQDVSVELKRVADIAFSGDGEPTTCKHFSSCVEVAARLRADAGLTDAKIVLITDGCYLMKTEVAAGLAIMDANHGEIWAKLDAGTEEYYRLVNRPNYPLRHVIENILSAARVRPIVIQSLFLRIHGESPEEAELRAYVERLREITAGGGVIKLVQVYTVARRTAEAYVTALTNDEVDAITTMVRERARLPAASYYGA